MKGTNQFFDMSKVYITRWDRFLLMFVRIKIIKNLKGEIINIYKIKNGKLYILSIKDKLYKDQNWFLKQILNQLKTRSISKMIYNGLFPYIIITTYKQFRGVRYLTNEIEYPELPLHPMCRCTL